MSIEKAVHKFAPVHVIGPLSLETAPLKLALRQEAATWKAQFAKNLHLHGKEKLAQLLQYIKETTLLLSRDVEDLEDVRRVMAIQQDIRTKESEIDTIMDPITHVYALLTRYEVSVPVSETEEVAGLKKTWGKMVASAVSVGENLQRLQGTCFPITTFRRLIGPITLTVYSYTLRETDTFFFIPQPGSSGNF
jgi:dynein heavy chain, axonemal